MAVSDIKSSLKIKIINWSAWSPALQSRQAWIDWATSEELIFSELPTNGAKTLAKIFEGSSAPDLSFVPIALRKKLSLITKSSLYVAQHCLNFDQAGSFLKETPAIFCSRHGESQVTAELLTSIAKSEPLSPMGFSRSVHNTASGLFGIINQNHAPVSAIAAGAKTFEMGLFEAASQLSSDSESPRRLLVYAEERVPDDFHPYLDEELSVYAVGFLIERADRVMELRSDLEFPKPIAFLREVIKGSC